MNKDKFKCTNCNPADPMDDNKLQLIVEEKHCQKFDIKEDGSLDYCDSDCDQVIFLECPICGAKYYLDVNEDNFVLQLEKRHVLTLFNIHSNGTSEGDIANINDLKFK